jgi:hypothetical protein
MEVREASLVEDLAGLGNRVPLVGGGRSSSEKVFTNP